MQTPARSPARSGPGRGQDDASGDAASAASRHWRRDLLGNQQILLLLALVVLTIAFDLKNSAFLTDSELSNIVTDFCTLIMLGVGETFVIISGGIDLSVGSTASFSGVIGALVMRSMISGHVAETPVLLVGTLICMAVGAGVGLINALLINRVRLVPFVATLATLGAGAGLAIVLSNGTPIGDDIKAINFTHPVLGPFSWPTILVVALVAVAWVYLHQSRFGRYTFAIGSNAFAARAAGINVRRHLSSVYVLSGVLAGLTGMFLYLRLGSGAPSSGANDELQAIAAVVIGGVSLFGGQGKLTGTILGALILTTVTSGLIISNVQANWNQVAVGGLIALAASLQALRPGARKQS